MRIPHPLLFAILLAASSLAHAQSSMPEATVQDTAATAPAADKAQDILLYALSLNGSQYKFGGHSEDTGFDCSGFVSHVFHRAVGLVLPHNARALSQEGEKISRRELKPGDLVFFNTLRRAFSHVGIYLGDNRFIHASSAIRGDVMISDLSAKYWAKRFEGGRRFALSE